MGSSLQEQLLKAGLVTEQQVRREKARGAEAARRGKKNRKTPPAVHHRTQQSTAAAASNPPQENPARTAQTVAKPSEKQDKKAASPSERKLLRARIKILLRRHRVNDAEAETPYHFLVGKHIRRIYVTDAQHTSLCQGQLVIIPFGERHYLISINKVSALQQLDPNLTIITHQSANAADSEADDVYAGYRVPDDLIW
ncbi:MAG: DUF2058 family protein [Gammaproteobacteria bacterium]|jgi:uncharacterized protein YaiL (DUF2058 family)